MSRSKKMSNPKQSLDRDIRKDKQRGFRRHVKLKIQEGEYEELGDRPRKLKSKDSVGS